MKPITVKLDGSVLGWGSGGIGRYLRNVLQIMAVESDLRFELLANSRSRVQDAPGVTERDLRIKGGPVWRASFLSFDLWRNRPDVYWLPTANPPPYIPGPSVVTVHDLAPVLFPGSKHRGGTLAFRTAYKRAVTRADHVLAVSDSTARDLQRHWDIPEERITVAPLGVSDQFTPGDREQALARIESRFGFGGAFALLVGTLEERKGLDLAIEIAETAPELPLVFVGRHGFGAEPIVTRGRQLGARFLGEIEDGALVDLYRSAEMLLAPSIYEGFGLTPLEAMACGCPVVLAGGSGSLHEVYAGAGMVVNRRSPDAWIPAMHEVSADRAKWVEAGRRLASQYTWDRTATTTADVFRRVAAGELRSSI